MSEKLIKGEKVGLSISIIIYLASLVFFGYLSDSSLFLVFSGLLPFLLYIGLFFYNVHQHTEGWILWLLPLVFPAIFLLTIGFMDTPLDVPTLSVINVILSYLINFIVLMIIGLRHAISTELKENAIKKEIHGYNRKISHLQSELDDTRGALENTRSELHGKSHELEYTKSELNDVKTKLKITKENFTVNLRSIEDKCKAINFVIGRVYSEKKGASAPIREMLRIDTEWYNEFSKISANYDDRHAEKLLHILQKIYDKLLLLEEEEQDLFKVHQGKLPVIRQEGDKVIEILARNDKDPIEYYHSEAKEICYKLMKFLREKE